MPKLDWGLVPGTKKEQIAQARSMHRTGKPIEIRKQGSKWAVVVLGVEIGRLDTKSEAQGAAHTIGRYKLDLGDLVYTYTKGYE